MSDKGRADAGFFSSDRRLRLPIGPHLDPATVSGYPIDLRAKAFSTTWPRALVEEGSFFYVSVAQYGLGCYERWLAGDSVEWRAAAQNTAEFLLSRQGTDGSWRHRERFPHTFPLPHNWCCGMAQGQGASLLVRLFGETGDERYADAARRALQPLRQPVDEGGVAASLGDGQTWPEEYPTDPPSCVLNGAIFAWWGVRDVGLALADATLSDEFRRGVDTLVANLHRFDTGWWTLYSLYPFPLPQTASSFYQALHVTQLEAMHRLEPRAELAQTALRWARYTESEVARRRALAYKIAFRVVIPRNRLLAHRLPWSPRLPAPPETLPTV